MILNGCLLVLLVLHASADRNPSADWLLEDTPPDLDKKFAGKTLVFTTPWNKNGDALVEKFATKIDYYSPCIFNIVIRGGKVVIQNEAAYDQYLPVFKSLKSANPHVQITPRLYIAGDRVDVIKAAGGSHPVYNALIKRLVAMSKKDLIDGFVWDSPFNVFTKEPKFMQVALLMKQIINDLKSKIGGKSLFVNIANPDLQGFNYEQFNSLKVDGVLIQNYGEGGYLGSIKNTLGLLDRLELGSKAVFFMLPFFSRKNGGQLINSQKVKESVVSNGYFSADFDQICIIDSNGNKFETPCPEYFQEAFKLISQHNLGIWEGGNGLEEYYSLL